MRQSWCYGNSGGGIFTARVRYVPQYLYVAFHFDKTRTVINEVSIHYNNMNTCNKLP
jgi:hypothetical protein